MPNLTHGHAHSAAADECAGERTRRGSAPACGMPAASLRAHVCTADTLLCRLGVQWHAVHNATARGIPAERRQPACWARAQLRRSGARTVVCLAVLLSLLGHLWAVEGLSDKSQRAKSYMRFGNSAHYQAYYDAQVAITGERNFFDDELSIFRNAAGLSSQASELTLAHAILKGPSHMSLRDPGLKLYGNPADSSGLQSGITLEAFVRIRDKRVLSRPTEPDDPANRVGGAHIRLPLMGNMRHKWDQDYFGQGYQLSCAYDGEPVCCAEAYTVSGASGNPSYPDVSACVSIKPMIILDPLAMSGELGGDCSDATYCGTSWFHITGRFAGGYAEVSVNQSSAYYSQPTYSAWSDQLQDFQHRTDTGRGDPSDSIQVRGKRTGSTEAATSFALASSIPFSANGDVIGELDDNMQYLFLRCDMDEVKIWVNEAGKSYVRSSADDGRDIYEGVGNSDKVCPMMDSDNLVVYIQERMDGNALNSSVKVPPVNVVPQAPRAQSSRQPDLDSDGMLAVNVDSTNEAYYVGCSGSARGEPYRHFGACGQTYMDRRAEAVSSAQSFNVALDTSFQWNDYRDARVGLSDRVDLWEFSPDAGVGSAYIVFVDRNFNDRVQIQTSFSAQNGGYNVFLDYLFDVEQFRSGLPFYNIAKGKTLQEFKSLDQAIPPTEALDNQVWTETFTPRAHSDFEGCVPGKTNCDGIKITLNLTLPDPWYGADGARWDSVCPSAFKDQGIDPQYRFLCTEWFVPYGRGWSFRVEFSEYPCGDLADITETVYRARVGYEARPEWYSSAEAPQKRAADTLNVGDGSKADCPNPDRVYWTQVGKAVQAFFRARDRNKDDAVDIVPADDPGLPNGAKLIPQLPARASNVTEGDTTRPRLYQRVFEFEPEASQVEQEYRVCMKARSYRHEETPLQFVVDSNEAYEKQLGDTISTMDYQKCDPATGTCPPTMWMDRCIFVKIAPPNITFGCSPVLNSADCNDDDYEEGQRLGEGATLEFTAGDTVCSDTVALEAKDIWECPDAGKPGIQCPEKGYSVDISLDKDKSDVPEGFVLEPLGRYPRKMVKWSPQAGKDERLEGYKACFVASDLYGIMRSTRCFTVRVRKCKYCLQADETLADVGRRFQVDWLQIYMANPHIPTPDQVPRDLATINTGVFYTVRAGDYLQLVGQRFFMTESQLRLLNPDVPQNGLITPGMDLCIMPPVCDVKCLYGTDCHIY